MKPNDKEAAKHLPLSAMPELKCRRPYNDRKPDGYLESTRDYCDNNSDAVRWLEENEPAIRTACNAYPAALEALEAVRESLTENQMLELFGPSTSDRITAAISKMKGLK